MHEATMAEGSKKKRAGVQWPHKQSCRAAAKEDAFLCKECRVCCGSILSAKMHRKNHETKKFEVIPKHVDGNGSVGLRLQLRSQP